MSSKRKRDKRPPRKDSYFGQWAPLLPDLESMPVAPDATCPDCGARFDPDSRRMIHEDGCPIARSYEAASDDDAQWFRDHPGATTRRRAPNMGEVQQQMLMTGAHLPDFYTGVRYEPAGEVIVHFLAEGVRMRNFGNTWLIAQFTDRP